MKKTDIKRHLKDYSISQKRGTTINHAFASALSIADDYDLKKINTALSILGQDPESVLKCAYCDKPAETWDHIKALVKDGSFSGHGHQINNLIPCCKDCNSQKTNKDWMVFLKQKGLDSKARINRIQKYIRYNYIDVKNLLSTKKYAKDIKAYNDTKEQVMDLLKLADKQANIIRDKMRKDSAK